MVFAHRVSVDSDIIDKAEVDALSLGRVCARLLQVDPSVDPSVGPIIHVYKHGIAQRMVSTGRNRFHGGPAAVAVPFVDLSIPGNLRRVQEAISQVGLCTACCCW